VKIRETVEFAAAVYDTATRSKKCSFQRFIKPKRNPKLTPEEVVALKITQEQIDSANDLAFVLDEFDEFLTVNVRHNTIIIRELKTRSLE